MNKKQPILSIITCTRGNFSKKWLKEYLKVKGDVEFVLVYPPGAKTEYISDSRVKILTSPLKGEVMQRFVGLLNAAGDYVVAVDDDDLIHPDVVKVVEKYFSMFPKSYVLRLGQSTDNKILWPKIPNIQTLNVCTVEENSKSSTENCLMELPIAPLKNRFNLLFFDLAFYVEERSKWTSCGKFQQ